MNLTINKVRLLRRLFIVLAVAVCLAVAYFEFAHRYNYGHFVPYGLHVDVVTRDVSIGIPGQTKMYKAELSNFSFLPVSLEACDCLTDTLGRETEFPYAVQRWDASSNSWHTIVEANGEGFCDPAPLSTIETNFVYERLWPGMSVEAVEAEATGAREPFQKGDTARFVVFRRIGKDVAWQDAVPSVSFAIEDDVVRESGPFRVKH
jgi:hypothetical protein